MTGYKNIFLDTAPFIYYIEEHEKYFECVKAFFASIRDERLTTSVISYEDYCDFLGNKKITLENSLSVAKEYVKTIDFVDVTEAFRDMTDEAWIPTFKEYLESDHKGSDLSK